MKKYAVVDYAKHLVDICNSYPNLNFSIYYNESGKQMITALLKSLPINSEYYNKGEYSDGDVSVNFNNSSNLYIGMYPEKFRSYSKRNIIMILKNMCDNESKMDAIRKQLICYKSEKRRGDNTIVILFDIDKSNSNYILVDDF